MNLHLNMSCMMGSGTHREQFAHVAFPLHLQFIGLFLKSALCTYEIFSTNSSENLL